MAKRDLVKLQRDMLGEVAILLRQEGLRPRKRLPGMAPLQAICTYADRLDRIVRRRGRKASEGLLAASRGLTALAGLQVLQKRGASPDELVWAGVALGEAASFMTLAKLRGFEKVDALIADRNSRTEGAKKTAAKRQREKDFALSVARALIGAGEPPRNELERYNFQENLLRPALAQLKRPITRTDRKFDEWLREWKRKGLLKQGEIS